MDGGSVHYLITYWEGENSLKIIGKIFFYPREFGYFYLLELEYKVFEILEIGQKSFLK